ncbi:MAG: serine/threonine protein kinase [Victivallaceae bacterium]|nr:serine/threonine protein kinase [Victivallaceae bacterium]
MAAETRFFPGELAGGFRLLAPLKVAKKTETWLACDVDAGRLVIKFQMDGDSKPLCVAETLVAAGRLPGLTAVLGTFEYARCRCVVMEYAGDRTLCSVLRADKPMAFADNLILLRRMLRALDALHCLGIVHRDVKPGNIVMSDDGAVLTDFGIARFVADEEPAGTVVGTPSYMSPEQARDSGKVDVRSDLFSLGSVLYESITGRRRFPDRGLARTALDVMNCARPPHGEMTALVPEAFAKILCSMMERDRNARPNSAADALRELDAMYPES